MIIIRPTDEGSLADLPIGVVQLIEQEILPAMEEDDDEYDPEEENYLILVESMADFQNQDHQLYYGNFPDIYWEYVSHFPAWGIFFGQAGVNQAVGLIVPDAPWLDQDIRRRMMAQATECAA